MYNIFRPRADLCLSSPPEDTTVGWVFLISISHSCSVNKSYWLYLQNIFRD